MCTNTKFLGCFQYIQKPHCLIQMQKISLIEGMLGKYLQSTLLI